MKKEDLFKLKKLDLLVCGNRIYRVKERKRSPSTAPYIVIRRVGFLKAWVFTRNPAKWCFQLTAGNCKWYTKKRVEDIIFKMEAS
jgi:hypothetical protein